MNYISSKEATDIAKKEFGENVIFLADDIFPASFEIKIPNNPTNILKIENWINSNNERSGVNDIDFPEVNPTTWVLKIKT